MSLVSTYVRADDGLLYRDPVLEGDGWFICFDDEDPIELVIEDRLGITNAQEFLRNLDIHPTFIEKAMRGGSRIFNKKFQPAKSWFFGINRNIPAKLITRSDEVVERDAIFQGVIYDFKT